jgi:beta-lactam-binding protein with PASTA domain
MVQVQVPNFIGLTFEDAERAADEAGIMLRISDKSTITIEQPEGHIYLQTHPAGTWIRDDNKPFYVRVSLGLLEPEITKERLTRPKETPPAPEPSPEGEGAAGGRFRDP